MKKLLLSGIFLLIYLSGNTQIVSHPQSFDGYGWGEKDGNNIILSIGKYTESYIASYDLSNGNFTYLNDSSSSRLGSITMIGDTGIALSGTGTVNYTHNNWRTFSQSTVSLDKIIKTNTGFLGRKYISASVSEYYHSVNGNTWTLVSTSSKAAIAYKDGKTWLAHEPDNFKISYDGGLTFINKQNNTLPSSVLSDFIPFDTLSAIGINSGYSWFYTKDGGDSWTSFASFPSSATFIYASNLDTIYANFTTGIKMTIDTGITWQPVTIPMPDNTPSRLYKVGNKLVSQISWNGQLATFTSEGIGMPWTQLHKRVVRKSYNDVSFYNNKGIVVGDDGYYCYSHDKGKTYIIPGTTLGAQDLKACEVINDTLMLVGDRQSNIYLSNDAGLTWNKNYSNSFNYISRKFRASADLSTIMLFRNGQNLLSTNQGQSWNLKGSIGGSFDGTVTPSGRILIISGTNILELDKSSGNTSVIKAFTEPNIQGVILEMIDENNGYAIIINTTNNTTVIYKTTDGWANYSITGTINTLLTVEPNPLVPSFPFAMNLALNIIAPDTLYINRYNTSNVSASSSRVYKSFNGGVSWSTDSIVPFVQGGSTDRLQGMHYFAGETFVSVWEEGRIAQNTSGNIIIGIETNEKILNQQTVTVYPNPAMNIINLQAEDEIEQVYLMDIGGKIILSEQVKNKSHQMDMSSLPAGIYFLKIKTKKAIETKKIIKQN